MVAKNVVTGALDVHLWVKSNIMSVCEDAEQWHVNAQSNISLQDDGHSYIIIGCYQPIITESTNARMSGRTFLLILITRNKVSKSQDRIPHI